MPGINKVRSTKVIFKFLALHVEIREKDRRELIMG